MRGRENALAALHQAGISRNAKDPGTHSLRFPQLVEAFESLQQSILRHVFRILPLAAHEPAVLKDLCPEMFYKTVERPGVPRHQPPPEFNLFGSLQIQYRFRL